MANKKTGGSGRISMIRVVSAKAHGKDLPLRSHTERALHDYFTSLNGHRPAHLYDMVLKRGRGTAVPRGARLRGRQSEPRRDHSRHQPRHVAQKTASAGLVRVIRRALLSVSDKRGLAHFAAALHARGIELLSTGGTARELLEHGLQPREVSEYTGSPELMEGRLKTLHPRVHGGLLGRRGTDDQAMLDHGIEPIDLLVVNLYPFAETIARPDCTFAEAIENIDIGGPAMLRAAAKNHADVTVVVDPSDYGAVLEEIEDTGDTSIDTRARLAAKAFAYTARYDSLIASLSAAAARASPRAYYPRRWR